MKLIKSFQAIFMTVDSFSDINSKALFNIMADAPLSFNVKTFRPQGWKLLRCKRQSRWGGNSGDEQNDICETECFRFCN